VYVSRGEWGDILDHVKARVSVFGIRAASIAFHFLYKTCNYGFS
jgi:hypothetical protein